MGTSPTVIGFIIQTAIEIFLGFVSLELQFFLPLRNVLTPEKLNPLRPVVYPGRNKTDSSTVAFASASIGS